jgi:sporulation protein YlmC with PRC-barrel domain
MSFLVEQLSGRAVIASDGVVLGEIQTVVLEGGGGLAVAAIRVKVRKDVAERLGMETSMFRAATVDVPVGAVQSVADTVLLGVPVGDFRRAPLPPVPTPVHTGA